MRTLDRKLLRDFRAHAGMLLAIVSIIAVGVACYASLGSAYRNLAEAKRRYYADCRMADFSLELKKAPLAEIARLAKLPGVAGIRARIRFYAPIDLEDSVEPLNGLVLSMPDRRQPVINDVVLREGSYFSDRRQNEVIVSQSFAAAHHLKPGDWIRVILGSRQEELYVVGTAISSEFVYLLGPGAITPDPKHFGVLYLKQSYAEDVFDFAGAANQVLGRLSPGEQGQLREVLRRAEDLLADFGVLTTTPLADQMSNRFLSQEIQGVRSFAVVAPAMFLAVAALVLNVLLTRQAEQQRTILGTLKALGYSDRQLFWHLLRFGLAVGIAGAALGSVLGFWIGAGLTNIYRSFFQFPEFTNRFFWDIHLTGLLISMACALVGALRGSRAVLRLQPAQAMRPPAPRRGGAIWLERFHRLWASLGSGWRMVLRNLFRARVRTAAGIFAAAMGASVLVMSSMMALSPEFLVDFQFRRVLRSDVDVHFKDEHGREALDEASRLPGVDYAEPVLYVPCTFSHGPHRKKGTITGLIPGARLTIPCDVHGRPIRIPAAGLAMSRTLAEILHVKPGQRVDVEPIKGLRRAQQVRVAEISEGYLGLMVYAEVGYLSRLVGEEFAVSSVQLSLDGDPAHRRALYHELKHLPALQSTAARDDIIAGLEETMLKNQWVIIRIFELFAGTIFYGTILNASLVSLAERRRELATLRVLGYGPWRIGSLLLRESMMNTLLGALLGLPLGYLLMQRIAAEYNSEMFRLPLVIGPATFVWTLSLAVLFGLLAHLFVQRAIHRMDWLDALKAQE